MVYTMGYRTVNELDNFKFSETHVAFVEYAGGAFNIVLDNVIISANNSCNRDILDMRTNNLGLSITNARIVSFVEEGYKLFDADGNLKGESQDRFLEPEEYNKVLKSMEDCWLYSLEKKDAYEFVIDANDHTYLITVGGDKDIEEWERFMHIESGF